MAEGMAKKIAIITGGSRGLGRNTAIHLARRGVDVIFTYRSNQAEAESLIREIEPMGQKAAAFSLNAGDVRSFDAFVSGGPQRSAELGAATVRLHCEQRGQFSACRLWENDRSPIR